MVEEQQKCIEDTDISSRFHRPFSSLPSCVSTKQLELGNSFRTAEMNIARRTAKRAKPANVRTKNDRAREGCSQRFAASLPHFSLDSKQNDSKRNAQPSTHHDGPKTLHCPSYSLYSRRRFVDIFHRRPATSRCVEETISRDHHRRRR